MFLTSRETGRKGPIAWLGKPNNWFIPTCWGCISKLGALLTGRLGLGVLPFRKDMCEGERRPQGGVLVHVLKGRTHNTRAELSSENSMKRFASCSRDCVKLFAVGLVLAI